MVTFNHYHTIQYCTYIAAFVGNRIVNQRKSDILGSQSLHCDTRAMARTIIWTF